MAEIDKRGIGDQFSTRDRLWLGGVCALCPRKGLYRCGLLFFCSQHRDQARAVRAHASDQIDRREGFRNASWKADEKVNGPDVAALLRRKQQVAKLKTLRARQRPAPSEPA